MWARCRTCHRDHRQPVGQNHRKWHIVTDTDGNMLALVAHTADIQDRDGGSGVINKSAYPDLAHIFADGGYAGDKLKRAVAAFKPPPASRFLNGPTARLASWSELGDGGIFSWPGRCQRLAKDWKKTIASADAWTLVASIRRSL